MSASTAVIFDIVGRDRASDKFDKVGRSAEKTQGKMSKLAGVAKGAAKAGLFGIAVGAAGAGKALFEMGKAAAEDQAGAKKLETALKNTAGATDAQVAASEHWISTMGKAWGVADDDLRPALAKLASATGDVGEAQAQARLAMDVSAGSGKSLEAVATALMKAQNGQVSALSRLGINTKDAEGKTISYEEAQKRLARIHGGQADAAANTLAGKMGRLKLVLGEAGEEIGAKLIPVVTRMADWFLSKGLPAIERFAGWISTNVPPIFDKVKGVIASFTGDGSGKLSKFFADVKGIFRDAVSIITSLWDTFGANIVDFLKGYLSSMTTILKGAFTVIKGIFKTVSALLKGDWKGAWEGIKTILRGAVQVLKGMVSGLWNTIKFAFRNAGAALRGIFGGMWGGIKDIARNGAGWIVDKIKGIPGAIANAGGAFLRAGKGLIGKFWEGMKSIGSGAAGLAGDIFGSVARMLNGVIRGINNGIPDKIALKGLPDIDLPNNPFPTIPGYARGTSSALPGYAWTGEDGPELVKFRGGERVIPHRRSVAMARGGGNMGPALPPIIVNGFVGNEAQLAKELERVLIKGQREANGGRPYGFKATPA